MDDKNEANGISDAAQIEALTSETLDVAELDRRLELTLTIPSWHTWCPREATQAT